MFLELGFSADDFLRWEGQHETQECGGDILDTGGQSRPLLMNTASLTEHIDFTVFSLETPAERPHLVLGLVGTGSRVSVRNRVIVLHHGGSRLTGEPGNLGHTGLL